MSLLHAAGKCLAVGFVLILYRRVPLLAEPRGDFANHLEWGRRFLAGDFLYAGGLNIPYPPFWALFHAPLALLSPPAAFLLFTLLGLTALAALCFLLQRLLRAHLPLAAGPEFWLLVVVLVVGRPFILRDLQDGGPNLLLVALAWGGVCFWSRGHDTAGGLCLGLASALKCTSIMFVAYFAWKRQWKVVVAAVGALSAFSLTPALRQGPELYAQHVHYWAGHVWRGVSQADPTMGVLGPEEIKNKALRPTLARFLTARSTEHHPGLSPALAGTIIKSVLVAVLVFIALILRAPVTRRDDPVLPWEWAIVSLLMLLYSPITWGQHCVGTLPAYYLLLRTAWVRGIDRWLAGFLTVLVVFNVVLLNRSLLGPSAWLLLESWGAITGSVIVLLGLCLACRPLPGRSAATEAPKEPGAGIRRWQAGPHRAEKRHDCARAG